MPNLSQVPTRRAGRNSRPSRPIRPALERLECRLAPATSLYVVTQDALPGFIGSVSTLKEYSTTGSLVRTVAVVPAGVPGEQAHDLAITAGNAHIYNGTSDANLSTYNGATGGWSGVGQGGTSTDPSRDGSGGVAILGRSAFLTDMATPEGPERGIVWTHLDTRAIARFAEDTEPIDVAAGLDGKLYSLDATGTVRVYDPDPNTLFALLGTITLPSQVTVSGAVVTMDYRALAVDTSGRIYAADFNRNLARFDAAGNLQLAAALGSPAQGGPALGNLVDMDFLSYFSGNDGGTLVVGSTNGTVGQVASLTFPLRSTFVAGTGPVFVAVGPSLVEVGITAPVAPVTEGNPGTTTPATFTVSLSGPSAQPVYVSWTTASGTATSGVDFQSASGVLTFNPGETTKPITVQVLGDPDDEQNETFTVRLTAPAGAPPGAIITNSSAVATVADDDEPATATPAFAASAGEANDNQGDGTFDTFSPKTGALRTDHYSATREVRAVLEFDTLGVNLAASPAVTLDLYVEFPWYLSTTAKVYGYAGDGTAALADATRTGTLLGTLNNLAGSSIATAWRRVTLDRAAVEALMGQGRYVGIVIVADTPTFFDIRGTASAHAPRINFWSAAPPVLPSIDIFGGSISEGNPGGATRVVTFQVYLSQATTVPVSVNYQTKDQPGVLAGVDYVGTSGTLTFNPGETYKPVTVQVIADTTYEQNEYFYLELFNPTIASFHTLSAGGQILNDDAVPTVMVAAPPPVPEAFPGTILRAEFTVTLSNPSFQAVTVSYATGGGTATATSDYAATTGSVTFAPGETSKVVSVNVFGDATHEPAETFSLALTSATGATLPTNGGAVATATIVDDDPVPTVTVAGFSGLERGAGSSTSFPFRVSLSNPSYQSITVNYATADGSALAGSDYTAASGTITFAPGQTFRDIFVPITPDQDYEPDETFSFVLSTPSNASLGSPSAATGTIRNDDAVPTVSAAAAGVVEGNSGTTSLVFTLTMSNPSFEPVTVNYATANGTAIVGSDYTAASGSVTFAPGQTAATATVSVLGDKAAEPDETFTLTLSLSAGTNANLATPAATGTIVNDDSAPLANAGPDQTADEGALVSFDGSASSDPDGDPLTFTWDFGDGTTGTGIRPSHAYRDNGDYTVTLTVEDGGGNSSTDTLLVTARNVAPTATASGTGGIRGQARPFTFTANDPSPADRGATFTYAITWGDGTSNTVTGPATGVSVSHVFSTAGNFGVQVRATDKDGGQGPVAGLTVAVVAAQLQGGQLIVGGTPNGDAITLTAVSATGVRVTIGGNDVGTFTPSGQIVVHGYAGADTVKLATTKVGKTTYSVDEPLLLLGGAGNDTLDARTSKGAGVFVGGDGNDTLYGGDGRAILIGGMGADVLNGGSADDVLIGGWTAWDDDVTALAAIRAEWSRTDADYTTRRRHLDGSLAGGLNGAYLLNANFVQDEGAYDQLIGNNGLDWFLADTNDRVRDRKSGEIVTFV